MRRFVYLLPLLAACKGAPPPPPAPLVQQEAAPLAVQVTTVTEESLPAVIELSGTLDADERSEVAAPAAGIVQEVAVDVGSRVKKGDLLVRIDRRDAAMRMAQATAATAQAGARLGIAPGGNFNPQNVAEVQAAREAMELAKTEAKRAKALVEVGSAAQSQLDQAKSREEQAKAQYDAAVNAARTSFAALQAARAAQDLTEKATQDTDIVAPFDGVIDAKRVNPGEYAAVGKVVAVIVRDHPLRLRVDVPEADAGAIRENGDVLLTVSAWPDRVFHGTIKRIGAALKASSRTLPIEAEVANDDGLLKPGYFAHVSLVVPGRNATVLLVPRKAIGSTGSAARVFVIQGGAAIERIVAIGRTWQDRVEIRGALVPGDQVALDQVDKLTDGAHVTAPGAVTATK